MSVVSHGLLRFSRNVESVCIQPAGAARNADWVNRIGSHYAALYCDVVSCKTSGASVETGNARFGLARFN